MDKPTTVNTSATTTVGIDLGDRHSHYCVVASNGDFLEEGKLATSEAGFQHRFARMAGARIVLEVGTHSPWVSRLLQKMGHETIVVDPRRVELISRSDKKTDRHDASTLALLGRLDPNFELLKTVTHRPEEMQTDLSMVRSRDTLVRARTELINSVRGIVKSAGGRLPACSAPAFHRKALPHVPPSLLAAVDVLIAQIGQLTASILEMDKRIAEVAATRYPVTELLTQIPGVGTLTALTYVLTIADPERFQRSRKVGAYLGLVPRMQQSGQRDPRLSITKAGDPYLRQLLVSAAHYIIGPFGPDTDLRRFGLALAARGDKRRAVVAVARKLAVLLHHLWTTGEVYAPLRRVEVVPAA